MLNQKKLEMAFKRYLKNWSDDFFEDIKQDYEECQSEIMDIVESNALERDHILLVDLDSIASYYLSKWKNDTLINGGNSIEELKKIQMVVFYQCMGQDLYKIRYPEMMTGYTFRKVVIALIHFTMFGWEREETIFFDFIREHLGDNIMNANYSDKHVWFLLELYLQYRNKTIAGTNQKIHLAVKAS